MIECGGDGFSIRKLAGRCGYTAPTIYHYFGDENPTFYRLIVAGSRRGGDRTPPSVEAVRALLLRPWQELANAGRLYCDDPDAAGQSLWALLHGLTALRIGRPHVDWAPGLVETAVEAMLRGLIRPTPDLRSERVA
jgi:AcrR family transcriptional regulator